MNEAIATFPNIRSIINKTQMKELKEVVREQKIRRNYKVTQERCCPPKNILMPTFITDEKFGRIIERLKSYQVD